MASEVAATLELKMSQPTVEEVPLSVTFEIVVPGSNWVLIVKSKVSFTIACEKLICTLPSAEKF